MGNFHSDEVIGPQKIGSGCMKNSGRCRCQTLKKSSVSLPLVRIRCQSFGYLSLRSALEILWRGSQRFGSQACELALAFCASGTR